MMRWYSVKEYAQMQGVCVQTVLRYIHAGTLPVDEVRRIGKLWRIGMEEKKPTAASVG